MAWSFDADRPIFQQIEDILTARILAGQYAPGEKLPAVRELALEAGVNPNTMQRALADVEARGLVFTRRGDGRYVSEEEVAVRKARQQSAARYADDMIAALTALGISPSDIPGLVAARLEQGVEKRLNV